jgi:hydroxymethylbilane synthase
MSSTQTIIFATRPSALALWQTRWVMAQLQKCWPELDCQEKIITTSGDRILDKPLPEIGGKGLFTQELESELLSGRVQAAVHSLKDLPVEDTPGLTIGAVPKRAEARDVVVSHLGQDLDALPNGASVGTSSLRRSAQLLAYRPDLRIEPLRGNVDTRVGKAAEGQVDAIILAGAGLERLGLGKNICQYIPFEIMLPAPGQGALAVHCRADDLSMLEYLSVLEDPDTRRCVTAERAFLQSLGGGCSLPVAAHAVVEERQIKLEGLVAALDGRRIVRVLETGSEPFRLGERAAEKAVEAGAGEILAALQENLP